MGAGEDQISLGKKRTSEDGSEETEHWEAWQKRASAIRGPGGQEDAGLENIVLVKKLKKHKIALGGKAQKQEELRVLEEISRVLVREVEESQQEQQQKERDTRKKQFV